VETQHADGSVPRPEPADETLRAEPADETLLRPVRRVNAFEETVERMLQLIKLGVVAPGERMPAERDLAGRFAVSRVTLREAIRALQDAGYVETRRGRYGGTFVTAEPAASGAATARRVARDIGADEVMDALVIRHVLECGAAEAAARRTLAPDERRHLQDCLAETAAADLASYRRADSRLHLAIAEMTGSPSVTTALAEARMRINELLDAIPLLGPNIEHSNAAHAAVVAAVLDGDADAARRCMAEHVDGTAMLLRGFLA
jgi:DNA-binding FadR family transcriptional regulator